MPNNDKLLGFDEIVDPLTGLDANQSTKKLDTIKNPALLLYEAGIQARLNNPTFEPIGAGESGYPNLLESRFDYNISPYDLTEPGDLEEIRAQRQSSLEKAASASLKFTGKTAVHTLGNLTGFVVGAIDAIAKGDVSRLWDNVIIETADNATKGLDELLPVYKTREYLDAGFGRKVLNLAQFSDELSDALSFTAGAVVSELLITAATGGTGTIPMATNITSRATKYLKNLNRASRIADAAKGLQAVNVTENIMQGARLTRQLMTGAAYEAAVETHHTISNMRDEAISDFKSRKGREPNQTELEGIEDNLRDAGIFSWASNLAAVGMSNILEFPRLFGVNTTTAKIGAKEFIKTADGVKAAYKAVPKISRNASKVWNIVKNPVREGLEEATQGIVSDTAHDFWMRKFDPEASATAFDFIEDLGKSAIKAFTTKEGWNEIGMGMLIGGIGAPGKGLLPGKAGKDKQGNKLPKWQGGIVGAAREDKKYKTDIDNLVDEVNKNSDLMKSAKASYEHLVVAKSLQKDMDKALDDNDIYNWKNLEDDRIYSYIRSRQKVGLHEDLLDELESLKRYSTEEFKGAFFGENADIVINKSDQLKMIDSIINKTKKIKENTDLVDSIYKGDSDTIREYMIHTLSTMDAIDKREGDMYRDIANKTNNNISEADLIGEGIDTEIRSIEEKDGTVNTFVVPTMAAEKELLDQWKADDPTSFVKNKEEVVQLMKDVSKIRGRRQNFIKLYNELVKSKFQSKVEKAEQEEIDRAEREEAGKEISQLSEEAQLTSQQQQDILPPSTKLTEESRLEFDELVENEDEVKEAERLLEEKKKEKSKDVDSLSKELRALKKEVEGKKKELINKLYGNKELANYTPSELLKTTDSNITGIYNNKLGTLKKVKESLIFTDTEGNEINIGSSKAGTLSQIGFTPVQHTLLDIDILNTGRELTVNGKQYKNSYDNPLNAIEEGTNGLPKSIKLKARNGKLVKFTNPLIALELGYAIRLIEEVRNTILNNYVKQFTDDNFVVVKDPKYGRNYFVYNDGNGYVVYKYKGTKPLTTASPITERKDFEALKQGSILKTRIIDALMADMQRAADIGISKLNENINISKKELKDEIKRVLEDTRQGSTAEAVRVPDGREVSDTETDTGQEEQEVDIEQSSSDETEFINTIVEEQAIAEQLAEQEPKEGGVNISSTPNTTVPTNDEINVGEEKEPKKYIRKDLSDKSGIVQYTSKYNSLLNAHLSNKNNTLTSATLEFKLDIDNISKPYWVVIPKEIRDKLKAGIKLTNSELITNPNSFDNVIDLLPIKMTFKDGNILDSDIFLNTSDLNRSPYKDVTNEDRLNIREQRKFIYNALISGYKVVTNDLSKGPGVLNQPPTRVDSNIYKALNITFNDIEFIIVDNNGNVIWDGAVISAGKSPGNVMAKISTANGETGLIKLNRGKLSKPDADIVAKAMITASSKSYAELFSHEKVSSGLTAGQVISLLVYQGKEETLQSEKPFPKEHLESKQLYIEKGKIKYGKYGELNVKDHTSEEYLQFVNYLSENINYVIDSIKLANNDKSDRDVKIGSFIWNKGQAYKDAIVKANFITTDVVAPAFTHPTLIYTLDSNSLQKVKKEQVVEKSKPVEPKEVPVLQADNIKNVSTLQALPTGSRILLSSTTEKIMPLTVLAIKETPDTYTMNLPGEPKVKATDISELKNLLNKVKESEGFKGIGLNLAYEIPDSVFKSFDPLRKKETIEEPVEQVIEKTDTPVDENKPIIQNTYDDIGSEDAPFRYNPYTKLTTYKKINVEKELKWLENILGKDVAKETKKNLTDRLIRVAENGRTAFGQVKDGSIILYKGAEEGTTYHEAFHIVSLFYLTPSERATLYNDARNKYNIPTTASDKEVEETLAEEFRAYTLTNESYKPKSNLILQFFKNIYNFIKRWFINTPFDRLTVDKLFDSIQNGLFTNDYVKTVNRKNFKGEKYLKEINGFTSSELRELTKNLTHILLKNVQSLDDIETTNFEYLKDRLENVWLKGVQDKINDDKYSQELPNLNRLRDLYERILDNFSDFTELIEDNLVYLGIRKIDLEYEPELAEDASAKDVESHIKSALESSAKDNILSRIKLLIATLPASSKRSPYSNMFSFVDYDTVWNQLMLDLAPLRSIDEMMDKIKSKADDDAYFHYKVLYDRLKNGTEDLRTQFQIAMDKNAYRFVNLLYSVDSKGDLTYKIQTANVQNQARQLALQWGQAFSNSKLFDKGKINKELGKSLLQQYNDIKQNIITYQNQTNTVKLDTIEQDLVDLLHSIYIPIDSTILRTIYTDIYNTESKLEGLNKLVTDLNQVFGTNSGIKLAIEGKPKLSKAKSRGKNKVYLLPQEWFSDETSIRNIIAKAYATVNPNRAEPTTLGADGNLRYNYSLPTYLTDTVTKLRNGELITDLKSVTYNNNSYFLNSDFNNLENIDLLTFNVVAREGTGDRGKDYFQISPLEDYLFKFTSTMFNYLPFPTLGDRKTYFLYDGIKRVKVDMPVVNNKLLLPDNVIELFEGYAIDEAKRITQSVKFINDIKKGKIDPNLAIETYHFKYKEKDGRLEVDENGNHIRDYSKATSVKFTYFKSLEGKKLFDSNGDVINRKELQKEIRNILNARINENVIFAIELGAIIGEVITDPVTNKKRYYITDNRFLNSPTIEALKKKYDNNPKHAISAAIADFTINTIMSSIETEKIVFMDPAYHKNTDAKVKRLPALGSTGDNLRTEFPIGHELHGKDSYKSTTLSSNILTSKYYEPLYNRHKKYYTDLLISNGVDKIKAEKEATKIVDHNLAAYKNVDQTDAQVYITPSMYREISIRLGEWSPRKEEAFNLIVSDKDLSIEEEQKLLNVVLQPLKMTYVGTEFRDGLGIPTFDKMSLATIFRRMVSGSDLEQLLDRMEAKGVYSGQEPIDYVKFETAVKIGNREYKPFYVNNTINDLSKLAITSQKFQYLRRQLVTDPHDTTKSLFATQAKKVGMSNVDLAGTYKVADEPMSGKELISEMMKIISRLSDLGKVDVYNKLGVNLETGVIHDYAKFYEALRADAKRSQMPDNLVDRLIAVEGKEIYRLDALPDRKWVYSRIISIVNKYIIDLKLPGNAFIQMSNFGLKSIDKDDSLKLFDADGYIEGKVSINLFKSMIPNYNTKTFKEKRDYILKNKDLLTIGYRIPTQGLNSMAYIKIVDVLPETIGDVISLPAEWTAITGSDFDIDKLYLIRKNYSNSIQEDGTYKPEVVKYMTEANSSLEERLDVYAEEQIRNDVSNIKKELNKELKTLSKKASLTRDEIDFIKSEVVELREFRDLTYDDSDFYTALLKDKKEVLQDKKVRFSELISSIKELNLIKETKIAELKNKWINENKGSFANKSIIDQNTRKAVENRIIDLYGAVLHDEKHFIQSTTPLDAPTAKLKDLAIEIQKLSGASKNRGDLSDLDPIFQYNVKKKYTSGKAGIGPMALHNVHHIIGQLVGLKFKENLGVGNKTKTEYGEVTDLSNQYSSDNTTLILDWLSALINAHVDIAKDPYIFDLNINPYTWSMTTMLIRAGMGIDTFKFLAQPILKEISELDFLREKPEEVRIASVKGNVVSQVRDKYKKLLKEAGATTQSDERIKETLFNHTSLMHDIDVNNHKGADFYKRQLAILDKFIQLSPYAEALNEAVQSSQIDTKKYGSTFAEIRRFVAKVDKVLHDDRIDNVEKIYSDTFLNKYFTNGIGSIFDILSQTTITASKGFVYLHDVLSDFVKSRYTADNRLINTLSDEIFSSIVSEFFISAEGMAITPYKLKNLLFGDNSLADILSEVKTGNKWEELLDNKFIKVLNPEYLPDENAPKLISMPNDGARDKFEIDDITRGWRDILKSNNPEIVQFGKDLITYSYYSSGFKKGLFTFFSYIPTDYLMDIGYNKFIEAKLETFNRNIYADNAAVLNYIDSIFKNNWNNDSLVPRVDKSTISNIIDFKSTKGIPSLFTHTNAEDLFIGLSKNNVRLYKPYIKVENFDDIHLYKIAGYDTITFNPIYQLVSKRGFTNGRLSFKEYGMDDTIFTNNRLQTSDATVLEQAMSKNIKGYTDVVLISEEDVYDLSLYSTDAIRALENKENMETKTKDYTPALERIKNRTKDGLLPC